MAEAAPFTFESVTIATFALIAAVAVLGAIISGMSGFGGGIIIAAFLAPIIGVRALVPVVGLIMLLETVLGPYWVWLALGEEPGARALIGRAIVIGALVLPSAPALRGQRAAAR